MLGQIIEWVFGHSFCKIYEDQVNIKKNKKQNALQLIELDLSCQTDYIMKRNFLYWTKQKFRSYKIHDTYHPKVSDVIKNMV